jgi:murein DD-endopeptidase MepM/ murein hydrolase activator NlpD
MDRDRVLSLELVGARWRVRLDSLPVRLDTVVVAGGVGSNLYSAALSGDANLLSVEEKGDLVAHLSRVYAWQIDFYRDVRPGDAFRLAIEREIRSDGSVRAGRVLAAEYMSGDLLRTAFRFQPTGESQPQFYDEGGKALRSAFLKAPLDFARVTSRFDPGRFHPLLGGYQAHLGVDYGATHGTPVRSTGDGVVARAGWWGNYGLVIEVDHGGGIQTRYAHLGGIETGVHRGGPVLQGQMIGRVGSTGLTTASHLHYEFLLRGIHTDPTRIDLPVERPIPDEDAERFASTRAAGWLLLSRTSWPGRPWAPVPPVMTGVGSHSGP